MPDLTSQYLGLRLRSPLVASASPYTGDLDRIEQIAAAGAGAIVLPSLFEEQIEHDTYEIDRLFTLHSESFGEATSFFPEIDDYNAGPDTYLDLIESAKRRVDIPVIASLNGTSIGGWLRYAELVADAGADALELNLYTVSADPVRGPIDLEAEQLELIGMVVEHARIPVAVKISPYYTALANFLMDVQGSGAAGVVMFNRFYAPDLDLETLDVEPRITLSSSSELRLPLRWVGIARDFLTISIAASTGVHTGTDAAKMLLAGADVTMTTSALLKNGPRHLETMEADLVEWMESHTYESVSEMRGAARRDSAADPEAYERANYIGNLTSYSTRYAVSSLHHR